MKILPTFSFTGYTGVTENTGMPSPSTQNYVDATGTKTAGRHTVEFGGTIYRYHHVSGNAAKGSASFTSLSTASLAGAGGDGFASFLLGVPTTASRRTGNASASLIHNIFSLYAQDNFRLFPRLTFNMGLRWDYAQPMFNEYAIGRLYLAEGDLLLEPEESGYGRSAERSARGLPAAQKELRPASDSHTGCRVQTSFALLTGFSLTSSTPLHNRRRQLAATGPFRTLRP